MSLGLTSEGVVDAGGNGIASPPAISNISPSSFSTSFSQATVTPLTFQLTGIPTGCDISITVKFSNQDQKLVALDFTGQWCWPFDVEGPDTNSIGPET